MIKTFQLKYRRGNINIPVDANIPENSTVYLSFNDNDNDISKEDISYASETYLDKIWNNNEDDVYEQLLNK